MTGFVDIVELLGVVPDKVDLDDGGGVVQDIHDDKRSCWYFIENRNRWRNDYKMLGFIYVLLGSTIATVGVFSVN